jgi:hypothetical protein
VSFGDCGVSFGDCGVSFSTWVVGRQMMTRHGRNVAAFSNVETTWKRSNNLKMNNKDANRR